VCVCAKRVMVKELRGGEKFVGATIFFLASWNWFSIMNLSPLTRRGEKSLRNQVRRTGFQERRGEKKRERGKEEKKRDATE